MVPILVMKMTGRAASFIALVLVVGILGGMLVAPVASQSVVTTTQDGSTTTAPTPTQTATPTPTETPTQTQTETETETETSTSDSTTTSTETTTEEEPDDDVGVGEAREQLRSGDYDISFLRESGTVPDNTETVGVRALGDPPSGFMALRHHNPTLFDEIIGGEGAYKYIGAGDTVRQNTIQVYGSAFGKMTGEYEIVLVYWQPKEGEFSNTSVEYASNQIVERKTVSLEADELYSADDIGLREHYDEDWEVTAWAERDGERVDGMQWQFTHRSNPQAQAVEINSAGGAWGFAIRTTLLPGIAALIVGLAGSRYTLRRTARGPGYGLPAWLFMVGIVGFFVSLIAYYQIAVILSNLPYVMGLSIGVISYAAGLTFHQPAKTIAFMKRELADAITIPGREDGKVPFTDGDDAGAESFDELTEALKIDLPEVPAVKTDDGYKVPVVGVRPFFARLFASAAVLDLSDIATRETVGKGRIDEIIHVSPDSEEALVHKPARMVRVLPIDTLGEDYTTAQWAISWALTAGIVLAPAAAGGFLFAQLWNIPAIGVGLGVIASAVIAYSAEDGWVEFDVAEPHYKQAEDSLTMLQRAHKEAKDQSDAKEELWKERATSVKEAREEAADEKSTVTDRIMESLGASKDTKKSGGGDGE